MKHLLLLALAALSPLASFAIREGQDVPRIPLVLDNPGIPGLGERMEVVWRTTPTRMYGLENQSNQPLHWTGYVYSGFHLFTAPTGGVPLTPEVHIGGQSHWQRTLQPGEAYWGPSSGAAVVEGGARTVHPWHFNVAPELWAESTVTVWLEPIVYGSITSGGHAHNLRHAVEQEVSMLQLRVVATP